MSDEYAQHVEWRVTTEGGRHFAWSGGSEEWDSEAMRGWAQRACDARNDDPDDEYGPYHVERRQVGPWERVPTPPRAERYTTDINDLYPLPAPPDTVTYENVPGRVQVGPFPAPPRAEPGTEPRRECEAKGCDHTAADDRGLCRGHLLLAEVDAQPDPADRERQRAALNAALDPNRRGAFDVDAEGYIVPATPPRAERVCAAIDCFEDAITQFADGDGREHWLCEEHGDALAVGFAVKAPAVQETTERWRRKRDPLTHQCRRWHTISSDSRTYVEECLGCGRQRARVYHS